MGDGELHKGHRQRMFKKFVENGINCFEDHEQLEMLLFSIYTRCNTNEISHRLISRFGSVEKVFEASIDELKAVKDVGETAAIRISFFGEFFRVLTTKKPKNISLNSSKKIIEYCCSLYTLPTSREIIYALYLDSLKRRYQHHSRVCRSSPKDKTFAHRPHYCLRRYGSFAALHGANERYLELIFKFPIDKD